MVRNMDGRREKVPTNQQLFERISELFGAGPVKETPLYERSTPLQGYKSEYMDLNQDPYSKKNESKHEVDDIALDNYINKILINQMVALGEGEDIYDDYENDIVFGSEKPDGTPRKPLSAYSDSKLFKQRPKPPKPQKRSKVKVPTQEEEFRDSVLRDMPNGTDVKIVDGEAIVMLPVEMLRQYICHDVELRMKHVHNFYSNQWEAISRERMARLAELIQVKESCRKLEEELSGVKKEMRQYKGKIDDLGSKVDIVKAAKKRRRQAKKQRKQDINADGTSDCETNDQDGVAGGDNNANIDV